MMKIKKWIGIIFGVFNLIYFKKNILLGKNFEKFYLFFLIL